MPSIDVYYNETECRPINYEYGDETLEWVLKQFDPNISELDTIAIVGKDIFSNWQVSLNVILCYGPNIRLKKFRREERQAKGGIQWSRMEQPIVAQFCLDAPKWRNAEPGLCLEGYCKNQSCSAFEKKVIINMGVPTQFMVGNPDGIKTNCPVCHQYVDPQFCAFNRCDWRCVGKRKENSSYTRFKTEWSSVGDEYYYYPDRGTEYSSLCIEVRVNSGLPSNISQLIGMNPDVVKSISPTTPVGECNRVVLTEYQSSIEESNN